MKLSDRTFVCGHCGISVDRDLNAARNVLLLGMQKHTAGTAEIYACGDMNYVSNSAQEATCL